MPKITIFAGFWAMNSAKMKSSSSTLIKAIGGSRVIFASEAYLQVLNPAE